MLTNNSLISKLARHQDKTFWHSIQNIRAAAERIWKNPQFRYYTDHTVKHSDRVIEHLANLSDGCKLNLAEVYIIVAAAYLHDIGMQRELPGRDIKYIRDHHEQLGADMVRESDRYRLGVLDSPYPDLVALTIIAHRSVPLTEPDYGKRQVGSYPVRMALLGALLRLADELELDHRRVDMNDVLHRDVPADSLVHWVRHAYTDGVDIDTTAAEIRIHYSFPAGQEENYKRLIADEVHDRINRKLKEVMPLLRRHGFYFTLADPVISSSPKQKTLPPEVMEVLETPQSAGPSLTIGGLSTDWIMLQWAHYNAERIICSYDDTPIPLPEDITQMLEDYCREWEMKRAEGQIGLPWNGWLYKLKEFDYRRRDLINGEELPVLHLKFGPTDYFTSLITDLNYYGKNDPIRSAIRNRYAMATNIMESPVREFATILGVNLNLITADGDLIVTRRSAYLPVATGMLHTSVHENIFRPGGVKLDGTPLPGDVGPYGRTPDPFRCALRAAQEELGVTLEYDKVEFNAFGVHPVLCEYSLIGWSKLDETTAQVAERHSVPIHQDGRAENDWLKFVKCEPSVIAEYVARTLREKSDVWFSVGLAAVVLSLYQMGYSHEQIRSAFSQHFQAQ